MDEKSIFLEALEKNDEQSRKAWLDEACGPDTPLRKRIEVLLERHDEAASFLERPPAEFEATLLVEGKTGPVAPHGPPSVLQSFEDELDVPRVALRTSGNTDFEPNADSTPGEQRDAESRYRLLGEIARGGMGAVIKGRDVDLGRDLAIKVLLDSHKDKPELVGRFVEEAQIGGQLQHPGIAPVYELGQFSDERPFFSMKLVKGTTLAAQLSERDDPKADRPRLLGVFEQVCQTMAYAHSRGVVHRDLKPSNVMVGAFGEVQVMDWGLAKVLGEGGIADEKKAHDTRTRISVIETIRSLGSDSPAAIRSGSAGSQTQMGSVLGTPAYMPPEQALGEIDRLDERSDVFGLGAILCEILTGAPPYTGTDGTAVFRQASRGKLDDCFARLENAEVDEELASIVHDCLALEPEDRPRNAGVLATRLSGYLESVDARMRQAELDRIEASTKAEEEHKRRRVMMALAASVLLAVGIAGSGWAWLKQKDIAMQQAAYEQKQKIQQQVSSELATARALANLESDELPDRQAVDRAFAAVERAEEFLDSENVDQALATNLADVGDSIRALKRDHELVAALESAWHREAEYRVQRESLLAAAAKSVTNKTADSSIQSIQNDDEVIARTLALPKLVDPADAYRTAFTKAGFSFTGSEVSDDVRRLKSIHPALRSQVISSLDRWRYVLQQPLTLEQWHHLEWTPLEPVELKAGGGTELKTLEDRSILASGPDPTAEYDLVFETGMTELSALRLEALLHPSLPHNGPGRHAKNGSFRARPVITVAPRSNSHSFAELKLNEALADYSEPWIPISTSHWHGSGGGSKPHVAFFVCHKPVVSPSGFRIRIRHTKTYNPAQLGRFRWSVVGGKTRTEQNIHAIRNVADLADTDPWRRSVRKEIDKSNIRALVKRTKDTEACLLQPTSTLLQLADYLSGLTNQELLRALPSDIRWRSLEKPTLTSTNGTELALLPNGVIHATGPDPSSETLIVSAAVSGRPITAVRLELVPDEHDGPMRWSRNIYALITDVLVDVAQREGESPSAPARRCRLAVSNNPRPLPMTQLLDGDPATGQSFSNVNRPLTMIFAVNPIPAVQDQFLRVRISTRWGFDGPRNIRRFRLSVTSDDVVIDDLRVSAAAMLELASRKAPSDYWFRLALVDTLKGGTAPDREAALRHATAAIALRPDDVGGHVAMLRSLSTDGLPSGDEVLRVARQHMNRIRELEPDHPVISELLSRIRNQVRRAIDRGQAEQALTQIEFLSQLSERPSSELNNLAWTLVAVEDELLWDAKLAVELAEKAFKIDPKSPGLMNTLGVAYYRAGNWQDAIDALNKSIELETSPIGFDAVFLAMAHWQLDEKEEAKEWFDKAVKWMDQNQPENAELLRFRAEAEQLMASDRDNEPAKDNVSTKDDNATADQDETKNASDSSVEKEVNRHD